MFNITININLNVNIRENLTIPAADDSVLAMPTAEMAVRQMAQVANLVHPWDTLILVLTLRLLMSYIYGAPILDVSRSHTTTQHSR